MAEALGTKALIVAVEGGLQLLQHNGRGSWQAVEVQWAGGQVAALFANERRVFAAAERGVWLSPDGRQWQSAEGVGSREVCCLAGNGNMVYACEPAGTLLVSHDAGGAWAEQAGLKEALQSGEAGVRALGLDPANPWTMWAASDGGAILSTSDAGKTWQSAGKVPAEVRLLEGSHYAGPWMEALTKAAVFAATPSGFYKSRDAGATWELSNGGLTVVGCAAMTVRRKFGQTIFLAAFDKQSGGAIFRSVDYGYRWERVREGLPEPGPAYTALCFDRADPYVVFAGAADGRIYFCTEAGDLWHLLHSDLPPVRALMAL